MRKPSLRLLMLLLALALDFSGARAQTSWEDFHRTLDAFEYEKAMQLARAMPTGGPRELAVAETAVLWARYELSFPQTEKIDAATLPPELMGKYFLVRAYQERALDYPSPEERDRAVAQMLLSGLRSSPSPHDRAHLLMLQLAEARPPKALGQLKEVVRALSQIEGADPKFALLAQARLALKEERFSESATLLRSVAENAGLRGQKRAQLMLAWEALDVESKIAERGPQVRRAAQELFEQAVAAGDGHAAGGIYLLLLRMTPPQELPTLEVLGNQALGRLGDSVGKLALIRRMTWVRDQAQRLRLFRLGAEMAHRLNEPVMEADFLVLVANGLPRAEKETARQAARALLAGQEVRGLGNTWYGAARTLLRTSDASLPQNGVEGMRDELAALDPAGGLPPRSQVYGRYLDKSVEDGDATLAQTVFWMAWDEVRALPATRRAEFLDPWILDLDQISGWRARAVPPTPQAERSFTLARSLRDQLLARPDVVEGIFEGLLARPRLSQQLYRDLASWLSYLGRYGEALELLRAGVDEAPPGSKLTSTYLLSQVQLESGDPAGIAFLSEHGLDRQAPWRDWLALGWTALRLDRAAQAEKLARQSLANPPTESVELFQLAGPRLLLALALARQGKLEEARQEIGEQESLQAALLTLEQQTLANSPSAETLAATSVTARSLPELIESVERLRRREPENVALQSLSAAALRQMKERAGADEIDVVAVLLERSVLLVTLTREECGLSEIFCRRPDLESALETVSARLAVPDSKLPESDLLYLSERVARPWRARYPGKSEVCWMGMDALRQLPLSALPDRDGSPLIQRLAITYLDGPGHGTVRLDRQSQALLVGGASDLKGSEKEMVAVRERFPKGQSWTLGGDLQTLKSLVAQHGLLHISTHGAPPNKGNALGARLQGDQQSLDAFQLANLTFAPNSLAVVATCESFVDAGTGHDNSSLVSALRTAGASMVVGSLWKLDDDVTSLLFAEFYRSLAQGVAPDRALAVAQRSIAAKWRHPYYWAGLQLVSGP